MAKAWEPGIDYGRLIRERFERAQAAANLLQILSTGFSLTPLFSGTYNFGFGSGMKTWL